MSYKNELVEELKNLMHFEPYNQVAIDSIQSKLDALNRQKKKMEEEAPTEFEPSACVNTFAGDVMRRLEYLFNRWQDEQDFEDFEDYVQNIEKLITDSGGEFIKLIEHPFAVQYTHEGNVVIIRTNQRESFISFYANIKACVEALNSNSK